MKTQTSGRSLCVSHFCLLDSVVEPASFFLDWDLGLVRKKSWTKYGFAFVSGPFPQKAVDALLADSWYKERLGEARDAYLANRKNGGDGDSPAHPFSGDGAYSWDTPKSEQSSAIRYTEGPQDKAWMEARDRNYVFRLEREGRLDKEEPNLQTEVPNLYAEVMTKRQVREEDLIYARKQFSKGGVRWLSAALKSFQAILVDDPQNFEALCFVVKITLVQKGAAAIDEVKQIVLEQLKNIPENQKALYAEVVNILVLQLLATGKVNHAEQALQVCETALLRMPREDSLLQSQQQVVNKIMARAKDLQDKATLELPAHQPPYSPRTHYHFFQQAIELENKVQAYTGQEGRENLIFLQREMTELVDSIKQLPAESAESIAERRTRLAQELEDFETHARVQLASEALMIEQKTSSDSQDSASERVRQWQAANSGAVDMDARPYDLETDTGMSMVTAEFRSTDCNLIANELVKRIRCEGAFGITLEEDEYIEIRCRPDKVAPLVAQALKATLSKLFTGLDCHDTQTIRLPWEQLNDKQVRKFEVLFAREKQDIRLASIQDTGEDIKSGVDGVARRGAPTS